MFDVLVKPTAMYYQVFGYHLDKAKKASPKGHYVSSFRPEQLEALGCKVFLTPSGDAGFAITGKGMLVAVFKHPDCTIKNVMSKILPLAKLYGATHLECFEGFLSEQYARHGFRISSSSAWNDEYAPVDWPADEIKPNYLEMKL